LPYRLVRPIAIRLARGEADLIGTVKALLGLVVMTSTYVIEAVLAGARWGSMIGLLVFALAPLSGFVALRFQERLDLRREALRAFFVRSSSERIARAVTERRLELVRIVQSELGNKGRPAA
jgi:hypothetical protein